MSLNYNLHLILTEELARCVLNVLTLCRITDPVPNIVADRKRTTEMFVVPPEM